MDPLESQRKCDESIDTFEIFNKASNPSQPIIVSADEGDICIQLEGSHTTATETDNKTKDAEDTGNLQCEEELNKVSVVKDQPEAAFDKQTVIVTEELSYELPESLEDDSLNLLPFYETPNDRNLEKLIKENQDIANKFKHIREMFDDLIKNLETLNTEPSSTTFQSNAFALNIDQSEINNQITEIETKNPKETNKFQFENELNLAKPAQTSKHTDKVMANKNLEMKLNVEILKFEETLAQIYLQQVEKEKDTIKRLKEIGENQKILNFIPTSSTCQNNLFGGITDQKLVSHKFDDYGQEETEMPVTTDKVNTESKESQVSVDKCSISTEIVLEELSTVIKTNQTSACQTSLNEFTSKIDLSLGGPSTSSAGSKSKYQNSLNNYTNANNACLPLTPEVKSLKNPTPQKLNKTFTKVASVIELTTFSEEELVENTVANPSINPIHSIDIAATLPPSSMDFRRPLLCRRLWIAIRDFLAAAFLCLRVNRDCIFCLGFFIAFVVSASFMTAFFYRTLSMSPSLFESASAQHFVQGGKENIRKYKIADLPRFSRL